MMSCARLTSSSWADILSKCGTENKGIPRGFSRHFPLRKNPLPLFRKKQFIVLEPTTPKQETTCKQNKTKQNKAKQSKASPFHSAFDLVLDVQIRSSAIIGGGNGENKRLSTSESLFQRSC